jgi:hypothetical protein
MDMDDGENLDYLKTHVPTGTNHPLIGPPFR